ncbi:MAG: type II toxin-antitoxin system RelE/ParE family toxin [Legionella sp.]|nr:type II toxin-antitoxin system RelE/ParE family toxin [Legionella sp.]
MKTIKTKLFAKWANKNDVSDKSLLEAAKEIAADNYEANYGSGVIKKRIANKGRGKSGSVRTIVAFKSGKDCFFIYGFEKSVKSTISPNEEKALKVVAASLYAYSGNEIVRQIKNGALIEVSDE